MAVEAVDVLRVERLDDRAVHLLGDRSEARRARVDRALLDEPLIGAAGLKQVVPRLDVSRDHHCVSA
jgi:hypothetical protein